MAEVLKEFANVALTGASFDSSGEYTVLTNNSTTQAVIKDINAGLTGVLANTNVALNQGTSTIASGGNSTGFELVPVSGVLKVKLNPIPNAGTSSTLEVFAMRSTSQQNTDVFQGGTNPTYALKSTSSHIVTPSVTPTSTASMSGQPVWYYKNNANTYVWYHNYDANSTTQLKYATVSGSSTGAFNTYDTATYGYVAIDPVNSFAFKQISQNTVKRWNLEDGSVVSYGAAFSGITGAQNKSSYNHSAAVKGVFFCQPNSAYTDRVQYFDPATGNNGRINGTFYASSNGCIGVTFNPTEGRYYILTKSGTSSRLSYIDATTLSGDYTATSVGGTSAININSQCWFIGGTETGLFGWRDTNGDPIIGKATSTGVVTQTQFTFAYNIYAHSGLLLKAGTPNTVPAVDMDIGINLKVSGVEITGV
jgi:hypothetical protein|tara:strand:- start:774 stop:2036 length:1263 start_codon:yes stop_codon:yes gene_type:complete